MALFYKQENHEVGKLRYILKLAFEKVKTDINNMFQWINYFHQKHQEHDERLGKIEQHLLSNFTTKEDIKYTINSHPNVEDVSKRINEIHERLDQLEQKKEQKNEVKIALKERLVKKITKNSKDYIKSVILNLINKYGRVTGPQLKEIVVEEQRLCSKSSFYRLLTETEQENEINSFLDGKEKTYFLKTKIMK